MGRTAHANYVKVALEILQELGGGPISTKTLVAAAQERGLVGDGKWVYHNLSRKVRESNLFDTSVRGQVSLAQDPGGIVDPFLEKTIVEPPSEEGLTTATEVVREPTEEKQAFPGPTLGNEFSS